VTDGVGEREVAGGDVTDGLDAVDGMELSAGVVVSPLLQPAKLKQIMATSASESHSACRGTFDIVLLLIDSFSYIFFIVCNIYIRLINHLYGKYTIVT
jgi:hypothetical protein